MGTVIKTGLGLDYSDNVSWCFESVTKQQVRLSATAAAADCKAMCMGVPDKHSWLPLLLLSVMQPLEN